MAKKTFDWTVTSYLMSERPGKTKGNAKAYTRYWHSHKVKGARHCDPSWSFQEESNAESAFEKGTPPQMKIWQLVAVVSMQFSVFLFINSRSQKCVVSQFATCLCFILLPQGIQMLASTVYNLSENNLTIL